MAELLVLSRDDVARCLDLAALRERLAAAFIAFSSGSTSVPPRMAAAAPAGMLAAMPGFVPGVSTVAGPADVQRNPDGVFARSSSISTATPCSRRWAETRQHLAPLTLYMRCIRRCGSRGAWSKPSSSSAGASGQRLPTGR